MANYCKFKKEILQVSYDNGVTWTNVVPTSARTGELIEMNSPDCGHIPPCSCDDLVTTDERYSDQYLTFVARDSGTFSFIGSSSGSVDNSSIQYSLDSGSSWNTLNRNVQSPTISAGQKIMWKSTTLRPIPFTAGQADGIGRFTSTGDFDVEGNVMSLYYGDNFANQTSLSGKKYAFLGLFSGCTNLISAENLVMPATTLSFQCYAMMFYGCTSLTTLPALPAQTLEIGCYATMFSGCTSLTTVSLDYLHSTALAASCYENMFKGCSSLTTAPNLPATTLAEGCYCNMFSNCTSLTRVPSILPATTMTLQCYYGMFAYCTSLTTAPELPATTLAELCYYGMFLNCYSLNYIKCLATDISASDCTGGWVYDVPSPGTFVKNSSMSSWPTGTSGIPSGWTVQNA